MEIRFSWLFAGVNGARDATLTFMVGGEDGSVQQATELLKLMGKNVIHCGAISTGQVRHQSDITGSE